MSNPNSLKPFQKGHDPRRNTKGRPKVQVTELNLLTRLIQKNLEKEIIINGNKVQIMSLLAEKLVDDGVRGKHSARKLITTLVEGKPRTYEQIQKERNDEYMAKSHGTLTDEDMKRLREVFPDSLPPEHK